MKKNILLIILNLLLIYSVSALCRWYFDSYKNRIIYEEIIEEVIDEEYEDEKEEQNNIIHIDFEKLLNLNNDVVGWIRFTDKINYPIVQGKDNDYYVNRSFDKNHNILGSIFMDYRNNGFNDLNTVIYGHNVSDKTMFGSLKDMLNKSFFEIEDNHFIEIVYKEGTKKYEIFSVYVVEKEIYYIDVFPLDYKNFLNTILKRSVHNLYTNVDIKDKILTLSTCYGHTGTTKRLVVHAKQIN